MKKKTWYAIKCMFRPPYWFRLYPIDREWDQKLWELLEANPIKFVGIYECVINEQIIWTSNHPYASGRKVDQKDRRYDMRRACSRATALLLEEKIAKNSLFAALGTDNNEYIMANGEIVYGGHKYTDAEWRRWK